MSLIAYYSTVMIVSKESNFPVKFLNDDHDVTS